MFVGHVEITTTMYITDKPLTAAEWAEKYRAVESIGAAIGPPTVQALA
jgi:hypothetical protein